MDASVQHRPVSQMVAGLSLIGFPLAGALATAIGPAEPVEAAALYDSYAAHRSAVILAACLFAASAIMSGAAAVGLAQLLRPHSSVLGRVGVACLFVSSYAGMGWATAQLMLAYAPHQPDQQAMIAYFDRASDALLFLVPLQLGVVVGAVLLAIALRRARVIPTWLMMLEFATVATVAVVQSTDLATTKAGPLTTWTLGLIFYGYIGIQTLRTSPEMWQGDSLRVDNSPLRMHVSTAVGPE